MKQKLLGLLKYALLFFGSIAILTAAMVGTTKIPFAKIKDNLASSTELLCERRVFFSFMENVYPSKIDRYADSITVSIANQLDSDTPLRAVMRTAYYYTPDHNENFNLMTSLAENYPPNKQYLRYWHGSAGVVRFLLMFIDLRGIYILHAVLMAVLLAFLMVQLIRHRFYAAAAGMLLSMISVSIWFVPFSLEYTWTFLVMLVTCNLAVRFTIKERTKLIGPLFLLSGIITNYLDFLTTETITLLVPMLLIIAIRHAQGKVLLIGDCDMTYDFLHPEALYCPLRRGDYDMMIGDRFAGGIEHGAMPFSHKLGAPFLSLCGRLRFRVPVHDFHCGLRGLTKAAAEQMHFETEGMEFATEMIAEAARKGLRIGEAPVVLRCTQTKRVSKLRTIPAGIRHLRFILK